MVVKKNKLGVDDKILVGISIIFRSLLVYAFVVGVYYGYWITMFISLSALLLTFLPSIISHNLKINLPAEFELMTVVFIYMTLILGESRGYYVRFWWWDNILHTFAGMSFGFIGFLMIYTLYKTGKVNTRPIFLVLFAFCFALAIGAMWEIFEFNMDNTFHLNMQRRETGVFDTMYDLTEDAVGGLFVSIMGFFYLKGVKGSGIFDNMVKRFAKQNPHIFDYKSRQ